MDDEQKQRDDFIRMQETMRHVRETVDIIQRTMATQKDLELLATKAEVAGLTARVENHERETQRELALIRQEVVEKSPGALWKTVTGWAIGITAIAAALAFLGKMAKVFA